MDNAYYRLKKEMARSAYTAASAVRSPYFGDDVALGPEGFQHLQCSGRRARPVKEQIQRFILLPLGLHVLKTATTVQEYRRALAPLDPSRKGSGPRLMTAVQWWTFVAAFVKQDVKVRVVVRKVGPGKLHFWSIMPFRNPDGTARCRKRNRRK
jgi:hypothetical protein